MKKLSLNGTWAMRCTEENTWHEAHVPGSVYTDLLRNGLIEDPFWRENELKTFPLMEKDYEYRKTFSADAALLSSDAALLRCEGLDTLCHVFINGQKAGELYRKYTLPQTGRPAVVLPSTSPANAAWSVEKLAAAWQVIRIP